MRAANPGENGKIPAMSSDAARPIGRSFAHLKRCECGGRVGALRSCPKATLFSLGRAAHGPFGLRQARRFSPWQRARNELVSRHVLRVSVLAASVVALVAAASAFGAQPHFAVITKSGSSESLSY